MVFGDPVNERIHLNEESIWAGSKINNNNPAALKSLPHLQKAIFESRFREALKIADEDFLGTPTSPWETFLSVITGMAIRKTIQGNWILEQVLSPPGLH